MTIMANDRGVTVCSMDQRYCIDNGCMIAEAGVRSYLKGYSTDMKDTWCTQR